MATSILHQAALDYAAAGMPVFPCLPKDKRPACAGGFQAATTDVATIDAWWTENPDYNVGFEPDRAGWCVIDLDGETGINNWAQLVADNSVPAQTWTVRTPRGGLHLYYQGQLAPTVNRLGKSIDTRGKASYVLLPPSVTEDGTYIIQCQTIPEPLPPWIKEFLQRPAEAVLKEAPPGFEPDKPEYLAYCKRMIEARPGATEPGRNDAAFKLANDLKDQGISFNSAINLMAEWAQKCWPPLEMDEIAHVTTSAFKYGQNVVGARAESAAEMFKHVAASLPKPDPAKPKDRTRFWPEDEDEQDQGADPAWLIPELLPDGPCAVMVYGKSGSYKSFLAEDMALCIASGTPFAGAAPLRQAPVFYAALEGRANVKKGRRRAWKAARKVRSVPNFYVMPGPLAANEAEVEQFVEAIRDRLAGRRCGAIIIDTVAKAMIGLDENSARDCGLYTQFVMDLGRIFNCPVLNIHHAGKDTDRGERGSSAFRANMDTVMEVEAERDLRVTKLRVMKHKDAEERPTPWYFEGEAIEGSLVFNEIDEATWKAMTAKANDFKQENVVRALRKLGAFGVTKGVATHILAEALVEQKEGESTEDWQKRVDRAVKTLNSLARNHGPLSSLMTSVARMNRWHVQEDHSTT